MSLLYLLICLLFLKEAANACVRTVPSYNDGDWIDDRIVPDWRLRRNDGFTSMLLVMNNYTFTCSGRLTTWYLWWIVKNAAISGCEVAFTLYVLRHPQNNTLCAPTRVGRQQVIRQFVESDPYLIERYPEVIPSEGDISVRAGDFIALQISIGSGCRTSTSAWLRGKVGHPNTVLFERRQNEEYFTCNVQPFSVLENAVGFISAYVEPTSVTQTSTLTVPHMQTEPMSEVLPSTQIYVTSSSSRSNQRSSMATVPHLATTSDSEVEPSTQLQDIGSTGTAVPHLSTTRTSHVWTSTLKDDGTVTAAPHLSVARTTKTGGATELLGSISSMKVVPSVTIGTQEHLSVNTASKMIQSTPINTESDKTTDHLESLLLLGIIGSLVISTVMLATCLVGVSMHMCRVAAKKDRASEVAKKKSDTAEASPRVESQVFMENNTAYGSSPTVFATYL